MTDEKTDTNIRRSSRTNKGKRTGKSKRLIETVGLTETDGHLILGSDLDDHLQQYMNGDDIAAADLEKAVQAKGIDNIAMLITGRADPATFSQAMQSEDKALWEEGMRREHNVLKEAKTYKEVRRDEIPHDTNILDSKWVFKKKIEAGTKVVHRCRIVVRGDQQKAGLDFTETFAPVARWKTVRLVFALVALFNLNAHQMDVKAAFLQSHLRGSERIYVRPPPGATKNDNVLWLLLRSLYGLKQAPREWNKTLHEFLIGQGFRRCIADDCLYIKTDKDGNLTLVVAYVDDLILAGHDVDWIKKEFESRFKMKDLGEPEWFLGVHIKRDRAAGTVTLDQELYIDKMLDQFGMTDAYPKDTPAKAGLVLRKATENDEATTVPYRSLMGSLLYASIATRPDIAQPVSACCRHMAKATTQSWQAGKRILRYLKKTKTHGITFTGRQQSAENSALTGYGYYHPASGDEVALARTRVVGFTDASWADCKVTRRSTGGYVYMLANGPVAWRSKLQGPVTRSTAEAEYVEAANATSDAVWLRTMMKDLGFEQKGKTIIYEDNQSAIAISKNPVKHERTKHVDIAFHFVRQRTGTGEVQLVYLPTKKMIADMLTKPLPKRAFQEHAAKLLGMINLHDDQR
jgi:hypothetical protein